MGNRQDGVLVRQARDVLTVRYGFTPHIEQQLRQLVDETHNAAVSAVAVREQCTFQQEDANDCLLLLEVMALTWVPASS